LIKSNINVLSGLLPGTPQCVFIIGFPHPWIYKEKSFREFVFTQGLQQ
jgi:hypothetical protein